VPPRLASQSKAAARNPGLNCPLRARIAQLNVNARFRVVTSNVRRLNIYLTYRQHILLSTVGRVPGDEMDLP
jgi:hypothetical protein